MNKFKKSTIYQVYTKSFKDSTGNGFGDIKGTIQKLDYLQDLGVDYLWMTPFFKSPQKDNGYDVADYLSVDPNYGTMADIEQLISEASKRNIGMMFDMVFNHTSIEHEWFKKALAGSKKYQNYYIFKEGIPDKPPTNWASKFGGSAWEYVPSLGKWYLHLFDKSQPDLNWDNPEVRNELKNVICFWKKKGVQGFRFDVVNLISKPKNFEDDFKGDGRRFYTDGPNIHKYLKELVADTGIHDMTTVGEMSSTSIDECIKYSNPDERELSMVFNFHHLKVDYKNGDKWSLMPPDLSKLRRLFKDWQETMQAHNAWNALFWCNHDQPRAVSRFGNDKEYWAESAKMLAVFIHMMRGTPYVFQGEELGMTNAYYSTIVDYNDVESLNYYKILIDKGKSEHEALEIIGQRSRDNGRTPMQWNNSNNAGFTTGTPWLKPPKNYKTINVAAQISDENSIYNFYKKLIRLRKKYPVISEGKIKFIETDATKIFAYYRCLDKSKLLVVCNFSDENLTFKVSTEFSNASVLISNYAVLREKSTLKLRPFEAVVLSK